MAFIYANNQDGKRAKLVKFLLSKKGRQSTGLFVAEGLTLISEIPKKTNIIFFACARKFLAKNPEFQFRKNVDVFVFDDSAFFRFSDTVTTQGIVAVCEIPKHTIKKTIGDGCGIYLVLEDLSDPGNVGTIIRTAEAFDIDAVFLTKNSVDEYNPKVVRSTMGSVFRMPIVSGLCIAEIVESLKSCGVKIHAASPYAETELKNVEMCAGTALVLGNETHGISSECKMLCDSLIRIPIGTSVESLNVSTAAAIILYESFIQRTTQRIRR